MISSLQQTTHVETIFFTVATSSISFLQLLNPPLSTDAHPVGATLLARRRQAQAALTITEKHHYLKNMKNLKFAAVAALLCFSMGNSSADGSVVAGPITMVQYYEGHTGMLIRQGSGISNPDACTNPHFYILRNTHPLYKEITALIVSSFVSGQPVSFGISGCLQGFPSIAHVSGSK